LKVITGPSYSILTLDESTTAGEQTSLDWFVMLGAGIRYHTGEIFFVEPSFNFKTVFYAGTYLYDSRVSLACGTSF
jgi:hypothetical protein